MYNCSIDKWQDGSQLWESTNRVEPGSVNQDTSKTLEVQVEKSNYIASQCSSSIQPRISISFQLKMRCYSYGRTPPGGREA